MELSFGLWSPVKGVAEFCAYTGERFSETVPPTFEHILPRSKGGKNGIDNCLAVTVEANTARGNKSLKKWLRNNPHVVGYIQNYLDSLRGVEIDGKNYVRAVRETLNREARGVVSFTGNRMHTIA